MPKLSTSVHQRNVQDANPKAKYMEVYTVLPITPEQLQGVPFKINKNIHPIFLSTILQIMLAFSARNVGLILLRTSMASNVFRKSIMITKTWIVKFWLIMWKETYPTTQRKQKVSKLENHPLTPGECNSRHWIQNRDLGDLVISFLKDSKPDLKQMSMALNGVCDAAVMVGLQNMLLPSLEGNISPRQKLNEECRSQEIPGSFRRPSCHLKDCFIVWKKHQNKQGMGPFGTF